MESAPGLVDLPEFRSGRTAPRVDYVLISMEIDENQMESDHRPMGVTLSGIKASRTKLVGIGT